MTTDDTENGWDSLADEFGLESKPAPKAAKPATPQPQRQAPRAAPTHRDPRPEIEQEADDFGSGIAEAPHSHAALYDPGPEAVLDDADDIDDEAADPIDDGAEGDESSDTGEEGPPQEGGKKRRRRRRRKKKGGPDGAGVEGEPAADAGDAADAEDEGGVEEGEAPAPLDDDDEEETPHSAMDEEMEAEAAQPRPEWHVMTWLELVSRLHRPG